MREIKGFWIGEAYVNFFNGKVKDDRLTLIALMTIRLNLDLRHLDSQWERLSPERHAELTLRNRLTLEQGKRWINQN